MPYMIRDSHGLYQTGGGHGTFSKVGKIWATLGALRNHLRLVRENTRQYDAKGNRVPYVFPADWEVVEVSLQPTSGAPAACVADDTCRHCKQPRKEHAKSTLKCCFDHTSYKLWEDLR